MNFNFLIILKKIICNTFFIPFDTYINIYSLQLPKKYFSYEIQEHLYSMIENLKT